MTEIQTEECVICTETLHSHHNRMYLDCGHSFHCNCVLKMFSHNDTQCPLCRTKINYQVPESELQERLDNKEKEFNELCIDYSVQHQQLHDYQELANEQERMIRRLNMLNQKNELELNLKEKELILTKNELGELKIKYAQTISEKFKLRNRVRELEGSSNILFSKIAEINRLKSDLKAVNKEKEKLEDVLNTLTSDNIQMVNRNNDALDKLKNCIQTLISENESLKRKNIKNNNTQRTRTRRFNITS